MEKPAESVNGFLFPFPHHVVERLFSGEKDVFVKLMKYRFLIARNTIVFYDIDLHAVVGEAKIEKVICADPSKIWQEYHSRIVLEKLEFDEYVSRSSCGPRMRRDVMTAFLLRKPHRYSTPRKAPRRVTPSGYYLPVPVESRRV